MPGPADGVISGGGSTAWCVGTSIRPELIRLRFQTRWVVEVSRVTVKRFGIDSQVHDQC